MYNILHLKKNINTICTLEMSAHKDNCNSSADLKQLDLK